jgi:hypothetical protein
MTIRHAIAYDLAERSTEDGHLLLPLPAEGGFR